MEISIIPAIFHHYRGLISLRRKGITYAAPKQDTQYVTVTVNESL